MVARYENLFTNIIKTWNIWNRKHLLRLNKILFEALERKVIKYHGQYLLAEKPLSETLNDINSRNEVPASS